MVKTLLYIIFYINLYVYSIHNYKLGLEKNLHMYLSHIKNHKIYCEDIKRILSEVYEEIYLSSKRNKCLV